MWLIAAALFFIAKGLTLRGALKSGLAPTPLRIFGYLFAWPGLDANAFLGTCIPRPPRVFESVAAIGNVAAGIAMIWGLPHGFAAYHPQATGWIAMVGIALTLHFGLFAILSAAWRCVGVNAAPIMKFPLAATSTSLSRFWGGRWNRAFSDFAQPFLFAPLAKRFGSKIAVLGVFLFSGLLHELVISVPARGGFGLPTAYFAAQTAGIWIERSAPGRAVGLGHGAHGWMFAVPVTAGPAYWLFHPPFVCHVILPMLKAIGAN